MNLKLPSSLVYFLNNGVHSEGQRGGLQRSSCQNDKIT